jgi:hypothetical protein
MKQSLFLLLFVFVYGYCSAQEYKKIKLGKEAVKAGIQTHYQWEGPEGHFVVFDLVLYKNGRFTYSRRDNLYPEYSEGSWKIRNGKLILRSTIQPNTLPIKINYLPVDSNGKRRIAQIRNLKDEVTGAFVLVNTDSVKCFYGDKLCDGTFDNILRVKVGLECSELQSAWINVKPGTETLQLVIDTELDLRRYRIFNKVYTIRNDKLIEQRSIWPTPVLCYTGFGLKADLYLY